MLKVLAVILSVVGCFWGEYFLSEVTGGWFSPNLLIIAVVFFNLFRGIRYSLFAAVLAGILKDSFHVQPFGMNTFSFVTCAYLTTFIKMYIYQTGSALSRVLLVVVMNTCQILLQYALMVMSVTLRGGEMVFHVLIPEIFATGVMTVYVMGKLKQCALKLFA